MFYASAKFSGGPNRISHPHITIRWAAPQRLQMWGFPAPAEDFDSRMLLPEKICVIINAFLLLSPFVMDGDAVDEGKKRPLSHFEFPFPTSEVGTFFVTVDLISMDEKSILTCNRSIALFSWSQRPKYSLHHHARLLGHHHARLHRHHDRLLSHHPRLHYRATMHTPRNWLAPDPASTFTQATSYLRSRIIIIYPSLPKVLIKDGQTLQSIKVETHTQAKSSKYLDASWWPPQVQASAAYQVAEPEGFWLVVTCTRVLEPRREHNVNRSPLQDDPWLL